MRRNAVKRTFDTRPAQGGKAFTARAGRTSARVRARFHGDKLKKPVLLSRGFCLSRENFVNRLLHVQSVSCNFIQLLVNRSKLDVANDEPQPNSFGRR